MIYYININNDYIDAGHDNSGSFTNQFNFAEFVNHIHNDVMSGDIYRIQGYRQEETGNESYKLGTKNKCTFEAQDVNSPWRVSFGDQVTFATNDANEKNTPILKNCIIQSGGSIDLGDGVNSSDDIQITGAYLIAVGRVSAYQAHSVVLRGSTIISENANVRFIESGADSSAVDCVFYNGINTPENHMILSSNTTFDVYNSVFNIESSDDIEGETTTYTTCQFGWVPYTSFPGTDSPDSAFFEQSIAPDASDSDITILASGTFTGYEKGLFGNPDRTTTHGIGAFNFGELPPPIEESAEVVTNPESITRLVGGSASFVVVATGTPSPTYQWRKNEEPLVNNEKFSGVDTDTLTISNLILDDEGDYDCVVENTEGSDTSEPAHLTMHETPVFDEQPVSTSKIVGQTVTFSVEAHGVPSITYQWYFIETPLTNGGRFSGVDTDTLTISNLELADAGGYYCVISNVVDDVISDTATLSVTVGSTITTGDIAVTIDGENVVLLSNLPDLFTNRVYYVYVNEDGNLCLAKKPVGGNDLDSTLGTGASNN